MAAWELLAPRRRRPIGRQRRWPGNLGIVALDTLLVRLVFPTTAVGLALVARGARLGAAPCAGHAADGSPSCCRSSCSISPSTCSTCCSMPCRLLWRLHRMHHADLDIDVTTGVRFHPIEILLSMGIKLGVVVGARRAGAGRPDLRGAAQRHLDVQPRQRRACRPARPCAALAGRDARHAPRAPFDRARARPTAISASICPGGTACSAPIARSRRPATTA